MYGVSSTTLVISASAPTLIDGKALFNHYQVCQRCDGRKKKQYKEPVLTIPCYGIERFTAIQGERDRSKCDLGIAESTRRRSSLAPPLLSTRLYTEDGQRKCTCKRRPYSFQL